MDGLHSYALTVCALASCVLLQYCEAQTIEPPPDQEADERPERWYHFFGRADGSDWRIVFAYLAFTFGAFLLLVGFCYLIYMACTSKKSHKIPYYRTDSIGKNSGKNKQARYLDNSIGGKSAARHERDNDSLQVDVSTFYQPNNKHNSKISSEDSHKHNSYNHTSSRAEEGTATAIPVIAAVTAGGVTTAALISERDDSDGEEDGGGRERGGDEGLGPSLADTEHNSSGHTDHTLRDASSLHDSAHEDDNHSGFGAAMVHHAGHRRSTGSGGSGDSDSIDHRRETRDDDSLVRKATPVPLRPGTDMSHVSDRGSERDNLGFEPDSTSKRSSRLSHHGVARSGSPDSTNYGDDGDNVARVSVAEVHQTYRTSREHGRSSQRHSRVSGGVDSSGLRRWPSQESLGRNSDRRGSDVGSINPTWRSQDDSEGVGFTAVQGYRDEASRDSGSEHDAASQTGEGDREHDSLADYERPDGVASASVLTATSAAVTFSSDRDSPVRRSPSPSPELKPQSPLGGPAPAGVSSGLAGLGSLIAARAKEREDRTDADLASLERQIDRDEDPSEVWLRQIAKPNRVSSANIQSKRGLFEELKAKTDNSWETRRATIRDSGGPVEYGRTFSTAPDQDDTAATVTTTSLFSSAGDGADTRSSTLVRQHIAQLETQKSVEESPASAAPRAILRRKTSETSQSAESSKPLETVSYENEVQSSRPSAINYENTVIETTGSRASAVSGTTRGRTSASLVSNPSDWPDEQEYARSERSLSEMGSGSNFAPSSRLGASSHVYDEEEEEEEEGSVTYEPRSSLGRSSTVYDQPLEPYPEPANVRQRSPPPSYHSAEDNASRRRIVTDANPHHHSNTHINADAESSVTGDGATAFSALDDAVAGFTSNDDTQSHVAPSLVESRRSGSRHGAVMDDLDLESNIQMNPDDDNSDIESDVQRNSRALEEEEENDELDSDDSGSGRKVASSGVRPSTPKPGVIKRGKVIKRSVGGSPYRDSVIGNEDPTFNQTMIF